jgi:hypothetical protein
MYLPDQGLLPLLRLGHLFSNGTILNRPVEITILGLIRVFAQVNDLKLIMETMDVHRFG